MRRTGRGRHARPVGRLSAARHSAPAQGLGLSPTVAKSLQEMGILQVAGAPTAPVSGGGLRALWQEVEALPRALHLLLSLTCFLLLFGLLLWWPWQ